MKKLFTMLLAVALVFSLIACSSVKDIGKTLSDDDKTPSSSEQQEQEEESIQAEPEPAPSESEETPASTTSEPEDDGVEDWTDCFSLPGLTTPEGFIVTNQNTRNATASDIRLGTAHFEKEGGFTEEEITAFAQMIWDACMEVSPDGIYQVAYVDGKPAAGTPYADLNATHDTSYGYYGWDYTHDGVYITIQVDYGSRGDGVLRLGCSQHQNY